MGAEGMRAGDMAAVMQPGIMEEVTIQAGAIIPDLEQERLPALQLEQLFHLDRILILSQLRTPIHILTLIHIKHRTTRKATKNRFRTLNY